MMISSLVSPFISASEVLNAASRLAVPPGGSTDERVADVQLAFPNLAVVEQAMRLALARPDQVDDLVAPGDEELGDQPSMAALPGGLGAHQARRGFAEGVVECRLPHARAHPRRVAAEGGYADAGKPLLARLAAAPPAELDGMAVGDPGRGQALA